MKLGSLPFTVFKGLMGITALAMISSSGIHAADFSIFSTTPEAVSVPTQSSALDSALSQQQSSASFDPGVRTSAQSAQNNTPLGVRIKTNADIQSATLGDRIIFEPHSRESHQIIVERREEHQNGDITLTGFIGDSNNRVVMTSGGAGTIASIKTPQGAYKINIESNNEWLLSPSDINSLQSVPFTNDMVVPVFLNMANETSKKSSVTASNTSSAQSKESTPVSAAAPAGMATIDVLVLYTPEMVASLGGRAGVETRINQLISNTNQAYVDSEVSMVINLVHAEEIDADNDSGNTDVTDGSGNLIAKGELTNFREGNGVYSGVATLRQSKGADLVVLLRDFNASAHNNCGLAYVLGSSSGDIPPASRTHAYSIVHDGSDQGFFCSDYTFAHEIGHNFGMVHDRDHSHDSHGQLIYGVFDYSFGHDKQGQNNQGVFGTIMSYDGPELAKFSNPGLQCNNYACGVAEGLPESADNAKTANNLRDNIAVFYPTATTPVEVAIVATNNNETANEENTESASFTVSRTGDAAAPLLVFLKPTGGSAVSGTDYTPIPDTVSIPTGQTSQTIIIEPLDDLEIEALETVIVEIDTSTNYGLVEQTTSAQITITDNDFPTVSIQATDSEAAEAGQDNGEFTLTRTNTGSIADSLTINLLATTGSATSGSDYSALPSSVIIPQNQTSVTVNVIPEDDNEFEGTESVILAVGTSDDYTIDVNSPTGQITIADNDLPEVNIVASDGHAAEAGSGSGSDMGEFTLTRSGITTNLLTVELSISGSAGDLDYTALPTTFVIPANEDSVTIDVIPLEDSLYEGTETVVVDVDTSGGNYTSSTSNAQVEIADNDVPAVSIIARDPTASEASTESGTFTISRTGITDAPLVVNFIALGGTATSADYDKFPNSNSVTIPANSSSATVIITPIDDDLIEGTETVSVDIVISSSYSIDSGSAQIEILDNDHALSSVSIVATDVNASETGSDNGVFTITRSGDTSASLAVSLQISGVAVSGTDYTALSNPVTIPAGLSSVAVHVIPTEDTDYEGSESVIVGIADGSGYTISATNNSAQVDIADNDLPVVSIVATDASAAETVSGSASDNGTFTISRTGILLEPLTVNLAVMTGATGSASSGIDYEALPSSVIIPAGQAVMTVNVTPLDDADIESTESVDVELNASGNYTISATQNNAQVTIEDNDSLSTVTIVATVPTTEEAGSVSGVFTLTRTGGDLSQALIVNFEAIGGTATNGTDYATLSSSVVIPAGQSSKTVDVVPVFDNDPESNETVVLTIAESPTRYQVGANSNAAVTIINSTLPLVLIVATDSSASETDSDTATFSILRTGSTSTSLLVNFETPEGTATSGADYVALPNSVTIPSGQASELIFVVPVDDNDIEEDETVELHIAPSEGYAIGISSTLVTISDNDVPSVSIVATDSSAREEGLERGQFTVSRTGDTSQELVIDIASISGSAVNGTDYQTLPNSVTLAAGQSEAVIDLIPIDDNISEGTENVFCEIIAPSQYVVTSNHAQVDIIDNEVDNTTPPPAFLVPILELILSDD